MQVKNVALYIRLSIEDREARQKIRLESNSISNQRAFLLDFCREQEEFSNANVREFCDDGYSGTNFERPNFEKLMEEVKAGTVDCIIVKDFSRFGRDYLELGAYLEQIFPTLGVRFISINDNYDSARHFDASTGLDIALRNLLYGFYSKDLSVKAKSARKTRATNGEFIGSFAPYGYVKSNDDKRKLSIDWEVAPVVQRIFHMSADGKSTYKIADILNAEEIPCPYEYKKSKGITLNKRLVGEKSFWGAATVKQIIKDERYTGVMVSNRFCSVALGSKEARMNNPSEWIIVKNSHEAIVSKEVFEKANAGLRDRLKTVNSNTGWKNSNNLFVCGYCGHRLRKSNGENTYLYCGISKTAPLCECGNLQVDKVTIEKTVLKAVQNLTKVLVDAEEILLKKENTQKKQVEFPLKRIEMQIKHLKNSKIDLYAQYKEGILSKEKFLFIKKQNEEKAAVLQKELSEKQKQNDMLKLVGTIRQIKQGLASLHLDRYQGEFLKTIIDKIIVFAADHIEIKMKNADDIEKILLFVKEEVS